MNWGMNGEKDNSNCNIIHYNCQCSFGIKVFQGKDFKKEKSFEINNIKEIEVDNENWNLEFKSTDANKIVIFAQGEQADKEIDPVKIENDENKIVIKQKQKMNRFLMVSRLGRKIVYLQLFRRKKQIKLQ